MHGCNGQGQHRLKPSEHYGTLKRGHMDIEKNLHSKVPNRLAFNINILMLMKTIGDWIGTFIQMQRRTVLGQHMPKLAYVWNSLHVNMEIVVITTLVMSKAVHLQQWRNCNSRGIQKGVWELRQLSFISSRTTWSVHRCNRPECHGPKHEFAQVYGLQLINISLLLTFMFTWLGSANQFILT